MASACGPEPEPPSPCTLPAIDRGFTAIGRPYVDLLLVIDEGTSRAAREALAAEIPRLLTELGSGRAPGGMVFAPVESIHVGVLSADLGGAGCDDDDALLFDPVPCGEPGWLDFARREDDPEVAAGQVGCELRSVESECSFGQPLEAALKALTPSTSATRFENGAAGHGDGANLGFLRESSTLAVVILSQGDDCSAAEPGLFELESPDHPGALADRCLDHPEALHAVERFVEGLESLRPDGQLYVMPIVGVPLDLVPDPNLPLAEQMTEALTDPRMQQRSDTVPVGCTSMLGTSSPPRRLVETAAALDGWQSFGLVGSTCADDLSGSIDTLIDAVGPGGWAGCFPRPYRREPDGRIGCAVYELLDPLEIERCEELPGRTSAGIDESRALLRCRVNQVAIGTDDEPLDPDAVGWVYDDFSDFVNRYCGDSPQRVAWVGTSPTERGLLIGSCNAGAFAPPPGVGESCAGPCETPVETLEDFPLGLACDPATETCQPLCRDSWDCDAGWTCFDADGDGVPHCVTPSC